jgi:hypothetical protein
MLGTIPEHEVVVGITRRMCRRSIAFVPSSSIGGPLWPMRSTACSPNRYQQSSRSCDTAHEMEAHQHHRMPELVELTPPVVPSRARFHADKAR